MPLKEFICPDNEQIQITQCLEQCRLSERCHSLRFLQKASQDREWRISPSCAGNGPRLEYLKKTCDYAIKPASRKWAMIGIDSHARLHEYAPPNVFSEESIADEAMHGTPDCLEQDGNGFILWDDKVWGAYKIGLALGLKKTKYTTKYHLLAETLQLNRYRIMWEKAGYPINSMKLEVMVRESDGMAKRQGLKEPTHIIPLRKLDDELVMKYYCKLNMHIVNGLYTKDIPRICNNWESWSGRRCNGYCDVSKFCDRRKS